MEKYVIVIADVPNGKPASYFYGSAMVDEINLSTLYTSRSEAKYASSTLVGIYADQEVEVREVTVSIALA